MNMKDVIVGDILALKRDDGSLQPARYAGRQYVPGNQRTRSHRVQLVSEVLDEDGVKFEAGEDVREDVVDASRIACRWLSLPDTLSAEWKHRQELAHLAAKERYDQFNEFINKLADIVGGESVHVWNSRRDFEKAETVEDQLASFLFKIPGDRVYELMADADIRIPIPDHLTQPNSTNPIDDLQEMLNDTQ